MTKGSGTRLFMAGEAETPAEDPNSFESPKPSAEAESNFPGTVEMPSDQAGPISSESTNLWKKWSPKRAGL